MIIGPDGLVSNHSPKGVLGPELHDNGVPSVYDWPHEGRVVAEAARIIQQLSDFPLEGKVRPIPCTEAVKTFPSLLGSTLLLSPTLCGPTFLLSPTLLLSPALCGHALRSTLSSRPGSNH